MTRHRSALVAAAIVCCSTLAAAQEAGPPSLSAAAGAAARRAPLEDAGARLTLDQCLEAARAHDGRRRAAGHAVEVASARVGQALSSRYPSLSATASVSRFDEDPNFVFPSASFTVPASSFSIPPMVMPLPANAFGPGFPPVDLPLQIPPSTIAIPAQSFQIPAQDITLMDRTLASGGLSAMYAVYTGGLAQARIRQARAGVEAARHESRQASADLAFDVTRAYYGVVLAGKLRAVAGETLDRMKVTLELTESLYQSGSGRVKKTDFLRHRAMVDTIAAMVTALDGEQRAARAALATLIGWNGPGDPEIAADEFPPDGGERDVEGLVRRALAENPRLGQLQAGIVASQAGVAAARAGHLPKVALFADLTLIGNSYDAGVVTRRNRTLWTVGVGVDVPLFQGFRVVHEVREARAEQQRLEALRAALTDGVALDVRRAVIDIEQSRAQHVSTDAAYRAASENRDLHVRAYQDELVETKDMIESQLIEAVLAGQFFRVQFALVEARAGLDHLLGAHAGVAPAR